MSRYHFTPQAADDLLDIWSFIARDNPKAADRVEAALFSACDLLGDSPLAGRTRKDLTPLPLRFWVVHPYSNYSSFTTRKRSRCRSFESSTAPAMFSQF
jgi:antitoxin ParD1/3/4